MLKRVSKAMEKIAPLSLSESWDNTGILIEAPNPRSKGTKVFLTIDLTLPVLKEAIADDSVAVIIAYHPPLFTSFKRLTKNNWKQNIAMECVLNGISVFSPHTSLDTCVGGVNDWLAKGLGPGSTAPITSNSNPPPGQEGCGQGRLHTLDAAAGIETMVERVKIHLQLNKLRVAQPTSKKPIKTVAICAGSGASILANVNADLLLTGEMSHHEILDAVANDKYVILCDHSNSERGYLKELQSRLQALELNTVISQIDCDPLKIL